MDDTECLSAQWVMYASRLWPVEKDNRAAADHVMPRDRVGTFCGGVQGPGVYEEWPVQRATIHCRRSWEPAAVGLCTLQARGVSQA